MASTMRPSITSLFIRKTQINTILFCSSQIGKKNILSPVNVRKENSITRWIRVQGHKIFPVDDLSKSN